MDESITPQAFTPAPPHTVRSTIAHTLLGPPPQPVTIGNIQLYPHQLDALNRIRSALSEFQGALLCDDVGLGKTYVALALAITYPKTLIVTPATLQPMWTHARINAYANTHHSADSISIESLSLRTPTLHYDFIVVDEAHHARNPKTKRYAALTTLCTHAHVLLMSATPIHNSAKDLTALLTLFLKDRALTLTPHDLSRILIRRTHAQTKLPHAPPRRHPTRWLRTPTTPHLLPRILNLPPPLPPRTAGHAPHLSTLTLIRQWSSSDHALRCAIRRRIARATAILDSINAGRYPTPNEIRAWLFTNDSVQLAFPTLVTLPPTTPHHNLDKLHTIIHTHTRALTQLFEYIPTPSPADHRKANYIRRIRSKHHTERIVAFSQYADTILALFHILKHDGHTAALTGRGGYIATGAQSRGEIIKHFAPLANNTHPPHPREDITLLLTTDLLSEGVNLQDASVLIHIDIPWTAATLDQRVGRIARIGSQHSDVITYGLTPLPAAEHLLNTTTIVHRKAQITHQTLGGHTIDTPPPTPPHSSINIPNSTPEYTEAIRKFLYEWLLPSSSMTSTQQQSFQQSLQHHPRCLVATIPAHTPGFIAACTINNTPTLIASTPTGVPTTTPKDIYHTLLSTSTTSRHTAAIQNLHSTPNQNPHSHLPCTHTYQSALNTITTWFTSLHAAADAGLTHLPPLSHPATKQTRATLRTLSREFVTTPWARRHQIALNTSKTRNHITHHAPSLTFHIVALLLLVSPD